MVYMTETQVFTCWDETTNFGYAPIGRIELSHSSVHGFVETINGEPLSRFIARMERMGETVEFRVEGKKDSRAA